MIIRTTGPRRLADETIFSETYQLRINYSSRCGRFREMECANCARRRHWLAVAVILWVIVACVGIWWAIL